MADVTNDQPREAPANPCASNDAQNWALSQSMFGGGIDEETGEIILASSFDGGGNDDFLMTPCLNVTSGGAASTTTTTTTTTTDATTTAEDITTTTAAEVDTASPTTPSPSTTPTKRPSPSPSRGSSGVPTYVPSEVDAPVSSTQATTTTEATTTDATTTEAATTNAQDEAETSTAATTTKAPETTTATDAPETTTSTTTTTTTSTSAEAASIQDPQSFYSCSDGGSTNGNSPPVDATELTLTYDYEIHTSSPLNDNVLSSFENSITEDLASRFGLITCDNGGSGPKRRYLRSLKQGEVVALDSAPVDESMADTYECQVPVNLSSSTSCTPLRGYMTAWLPNSSSTEEADTTETQLLALIQNGMTSDLYTNKNVVKVAYVGVRQEDGNGGPTQDGTTQDGTQDGSQSDNSTGNNSDNNTSGNGLEVDGAKESESGDPSQELESNGPPFLAIGISLFCIAFALAIALGVFIRRKRRKQYFSEGPASSDNDMGNQSLAAQAALTSDSNDLDDVQLLPSPDKLDMRSLYSEDMSTDVETENYNYGNQNDIDDKEATSKYGMLYGENYGDGGADIILQSLSTNATEDYSDLANSNGGDKNDAANIITPKNSNTTSRMSAGSSLAAMGVASTLAARSYNATAATTASPTVVSQDTNSEPSNVGSHVGTVEDTSLASSSSKEEEVVHTSMDSMEEGTFQSDGPIAWA
eukprot:CAMPEP_0172303724 /NCGR_PEP_ID=MMETSP1058-20130122/5235_1 /TAXON_ID=83371 /ORGANISM="Detonula confervacea, Strain CCMP 353" /LENGTH=700 /DNA_ID=CAMNT_0013014667 /DNA_START=128 /DNA_END=2230 /DNA_ORIENTATION=-